MRRDTGHTLRDIEHRHAVERIRDGVAGGNAGST